MKKLEDLQVTQVGAFMAKTKFKLDGIRYKGKLKPHQWNSYECR